MILQHLVSSASHVAGRLKTPIDTENVTSCLICIAIIDPYLQVSLFAAPVSLSPHLNGYSTSVIRVRPNTLSQQTLRLMKTLPKGIKK